MAREAAGMSGFDFSNAMVVVTGAGAGIGQGIAQAFYAAGGRVALGDLRKDAVERATAGLGGERTFAGAVDVRDEKSVQAFFAAAERALGPVTIAVANAGIYPNCPVLDMTVDEIVAHVVPKEGASIDPKDLFEFCNANMAYFMVPRYLVVRKELPKTGTMRVEKYKLRQEGISAGAADRAELGITLKR